MRVRGTVQVPGDKSLSHRALILAALGTGTSRIRSVLRSADVRATADCLRALGVDVPDLAADLSVAGRGLRGLTAPGRSLDAMNSGTTVRLLAGVVAGHPFATTFTGDASLSRRPMRRVAAPLEAMGATVRLSDAGTLPMTVTGGALESIAWDSATASAQVKSCVLLAGLVAGVGVTVREPSRSRDHTERMLLAMGARVSSESTQVQLEPCASLAPLDARIPGDPSSAAFFAALAASADAGDLLLPHVGLNPTRTGFFTTLQRMGALVDVVEQRVEGGEPVGTVRIRSRGLQGRTVGGEVIPTMIDELPLLACLGALAEGETVIRDAVELRSKESDRIAIVVANLRALGADAEELPDGLRVVGGRGTLRAGAVATHGDHRIAMAFAILGTVGGIEVDIDDRACVAVSYPDFWRDLASVTQ